MVVLVSTEARRVVAFLIGGSLAVAALWVVQSSATGILAYLALFGAILAAVLTVSFAIAVVVEGTVDVRARNRLGDRLGGKGSSTSKERCSICRRPVVDVDGTTLCAACDQKPTL